MKSLLIFFAVIAAAFAWWEEVSEQDYRSSMTDANAQDHSHSEDVFQAGQSYLILGNNNKFLSAINYGGRGGQNYIQAVKTQQDGFCRFAASNLNNGKIALRGFNGKGRYLQLNPGQDHNNIRPTTDVIDESAQFEVEVDPNGPWLGAHYVYLKAKNGKYWGIVSGPVKNNIAADYDDNDNDNTRFIVLDA